MLHGPEIIDSGSALRLISYLQKLGPVRAVLGGTMGRVALIDAGLQDAVQVSPRRRPSQSIRDLDAICDIIFLLNLAKSRESGLAFGIMIAQASGKGKPLIQIDCGGRFVCLLRGDGEAAILAARLALDLGLDLLSTYPIQSICSDDESGGIRRTLSSVYPGELISVNGTVIGRAAEGQVEIEARGGRIVDIKGMAVKQHGLEKLDYVDLKRAIIRSGSIRRTSAPQKRDAFGRIGSHKDVAEAAFIDHCAEDAFEAAFGAGVAVSVGDDTTAIAGDVLSRLGIIIMGIVDGDLDRLGGSTDIMPGSIIFRVLPGYDDVVGRLVMARIFKGRSRIRIAPGELAENIEAIAGIRLMEIKRIEPIKPE
ncbi:MAG: DUF2117 domain-containing protein [Methanothrix sp.]|nr:DUF2117 domain-containing protein [Methanothrix sp.]OYV09728.1 MAG: hypothetical protein CG437_772 [Methanosaeta sp. NSP1]